MGLMRIVSKFHHNIILTIWAELCQDQDKINWSNWFDWFDSIKVVEPNTLNILIKLIKLNKLIKLIDLDSVELSGPMLENIGYQVSSWVTDFHDGVAGGIENKAKGRFQSTKHVSVNCDLLLDRLTKCSSSKKIKPSKFL